MIGIELDSDSSVVESALNDLSDALTSVKSKEEVREFLRRLEGLIDIQLMSGKSTGLDCEKMSRAALGFALGFTLGLTPETEKLYKECGVYHSYFPKDCLLSEYNMNIFAMFVSIVTHSDGISIEEFIRTVSSVLVRCVAAILPEHQLVNSTPRSVN